MTYIDTLRSVGLSKAEAIIYDLLLEYGELKASDIIRRSELKRGNVYNTLHELTARELITEIEKNGVAHYRPNHPTHLRAQIEEHEREIRRRESALESILPDLVDSYDQAHNKPRVQYFEGSDGLREALYNSLETDGKILTYADIDAVRAFMKKENDEYVKKRKDNGIHKKVLVFESSSAENLEGDEYTEFRVIPGEKPEYVEAAMEIYDNKVSYLTISEERKFAVIIEDPRIADFHRLLFMSQWNQFA